MGLINGRPLYTGIYEPSINIDVDIKIRIQVGDLEMKWFEH